ncbi:hypothetical protein GCM10010289_85250 [Streptomyces violascens]|uniref:Uncharacterized protein n=1 Tax=Streptomyces violascens TaxID=67381 RepID=A0ABQ3QST8_9ACTN|nr:hypothetical protein GCM10010289_85250 [Streptomyces violascens]GHI40343.1 hypothetical protein Sviol_47510 [Streptomyces violascens]
MPLFDKPWLALVLAGDPDSPAQTGGDPYSVIVNVAANDWLAGHNPWRGRLHGMRGQPERGRPRLAGPHCPCLRCKDHPRRRLTPHADDKWQRRTGDSGR